MQNIGLRMGNPAAPARAAASATILLGLTSIIGWVLGIQALTSIVPGSVEMKINTAIGVVLAGTALLILSDGASLRLERVAQVVSAAVFLLGAATVIEYVVGRQFGIDELLVKDRAGAYNVFHGRMSPVTAAAFVAVTAALVALPHRRLRGIAQAGAACAILVGVISLLGYFWGAAELITDRWLPPVALNTASCFALLGIGILLAPRKLSTQLDDRLSNLAAVEIKILAGFIIALSLLLLGGSYTYRTSVRLAESMDWVAHSQRVRAALQSVYGSLAGSEVALRDYLLTKADDNEREHVLLRRDVLAHLDEIKRLTADNPVQQSNWLALQPLVIGRLAAMADTKRAFADFGLAAARAVIATTRNAYPTRAVRGQISVMDAEEVRLLNERTAASAGVRATTLLSLIATLTIASGLFFALFRGVHREMRARREAETSLRSSDQYNRSILDSSPDCLGILSLEGRLMQMTPHGMQLMEIEDFATVEHTDWVKIWKGDQRDTARRALQSARDGVDGRFQGACPTVKGTAKWWDVIVMPIFGADGRPVRLLAVSRDITEVKRTEDELRETNAFLDLLFEALPVMVYVKDARTLRYIRLNRECERLSGFERSSVIGKTVQELLPADEAAVVQASDMQVLTSGRMLEIEEEVLSTFDRTPRSRHTMKLPIADASGAAQYLLGISEDITEQKEAERAIHELNTALEIKAAQLQTTNHELESFSYSVSHDLRAPLRAIDGFALMIQEDYSDTLDTEGHRYLTVIRDNSRRMGALIDDLLEFSRLGRLPVVTHHINVDLLVREVVAEVLSNREFAAPRIEIGSLPPARGDRGLLRQVWTNLIANAVKYSSKAAAPQISVSGEQVAGENRYSVRDNGVGFDMAYAEKLFGVFQRLHRSDEFSGTGVGLAIVHRVVTRHGGRVWADGKLNQGAVFSFALPRGEENG